MITDVVFVIAKWQTPTVTQLILHAKPRAVFPLFLTTQKLGISNIMRTRCTIWVGGDGTPVLHLSCCVRFGIESSYADTLAIEIILGRVAIIARVVHTAGIG